MALGGLDLSGALALGQLCLLAVPLIAMRLAHTDSRSIGVARAPLSYGAAALLVGVSLWYVNVRLVSLIDVPESDLRLLEQMIDKPSLVVAVLTIGVLPAISEEIVFRGVLVRGLATRFHAPIAIGIAAAVFSLYHLNPVQMLPTFTLGLALGTIALRAGSSLPTMLCHAANNIVALLIGRGELPGLMSPDHTGWLDQHPTLALAGATATTTTGIAIAMVSPRAAAPVTGGDV